MRVVLAIAIATIAASGSLLLFAEQVQRETLETRVADAVTLAMTTGAREQCEADPTRFVERSSARAERAQRRGRGSRRAAARMAPIVGARFAVFDAEGTSASGAPPLDRALLDRLSRDTVVSLPEQNGLARFLVQMPWDDGPCTIVGVERPISPDMTTGRRRGLFFALAVLLVAAGAAVLALRSPLSRLRTLTEAARALGRSGFRDRSALDRATPRASSREVPPRDEIGALAASLRDAVDRIAEDAARLSARDAALTEYVVHTTHDLMTPVTVLTGHLAELEEDLAQGKAIERRTVERAIGEAHYLATLVANLGVVARLDRPDPIVQRRTIDLREVVERVAARHEPLARTKGLVLEHAVPDDPCPFEGDDLLLERALGHLVHNAIRHHRAADGTEGHVALVLSVTRGALSIRVVDDGAGLDEASLRTLVASARGEVGDADASRTRKHGFGMDVVRRVASLHGLELVVERAESGGLSVTLSSPATSSGPASPIGSVRSIRA
jgi:signal transduction histidine kinase